MRTGTAERSKVRRHSSLAFLGLCGLLLGERSMTQSKGNSDIQASAEYADFIRAVAVPTALAETRPGEYVKFLRLGKNDGGEIVVLGIGLLPLNEHASAELEEGASVSAIAHVHHKLVSQTPVRDDALTVRGLGVPNFVISHDGRAIWEVGVIAGQDMYRAIGPENPGEWKRLGYAASPEGTLVEDADICTVLANPLAYDHKLLRLTGMVTRDFETFWIKGPNCANVKALWIEYGGPKPADGPEWHDGPENPSENAPLLIEGIRTSLVADSKFRQFDSITRSLKRGKRASATLVGWVVSAGVTRDEAGNEEEIGYGPYGMYSLFVIQKVDSVSRRWR